MNFPNEGVRIFSNVDIHMKIAVVLEILANICFKCIPTIRDNGIVPHIESRIPSSATFSIY